MHGFVTFLSLLSLLAFFLYLWMRRADDCVTVRVRFTAEPQGREQRQYGADLGSVVENDKLIILTPVLF